MWFWSKVGFALAPDTLFIYLKLWLRLTELVPDLVLPKTACTLCFRTKITENMFGNLTTMWYSMCLPAIAQSDQGLC